MSLNNWSYAITVVVARLWSDCLETNNSNEQSWLISGENTDVHKDMNARIVTHKFMFN